MPSHQIRATPLIHIQKPPWSVSINFKSTTKTLGSSLTRLSLWLSERFGLIRMSSKHLRQSIGLGVKPHNGLVLARALRKRFDHIPILWSCCRLRDTDGLVCGLDYRVAMWTSCLIWHTSRLFEPKVLADPSRLLQRVLLSSLDHGLSR
jgi:hypothetical protein